jgi:hypothetical protein
MPRFTQEDLDAIRIRVPIAGVIGRRVPLARAGRQLSGCCPFHLERKPSFYVYSDHYHCFGCGAHGDVIRFAMDVDGLSFVDAVERLASDGGVTATPVSARADDDAAAERYRRYAAAIWLAATPSILGTPVERYLAGRCIDLACLARVPSALRFHPGLPHRPSGRTMPAMVAAIHGADGKHLSTHRTWLEPVGRDWIKARVPNAKLTVGMYPGGSIRLARGPSGKSLRDAPADDTVIIGEGIETCLTIAAACPELRVIAAVSQGNLGGVWLPDQLRNVILASDNDVKPVARERFQRIVEQHMDAGRNVRVVRSPLGNDFNDAALAWKRAA